MRLVQSIPRNRWPRINRPRLPATVWTWLVPVVALLAGLLGSTTARTAQGTDLRSNQSNLADLIRTTEAKATTYDARLTTLQAQVASATKAFARSDAGLAAVTAKSRPLLPAAGLTGVSGPGLTVVLDDAPTVAGASDAVKNDLVVHQSDMQAVVNALWAGGAEAMSVMGQRLIATSAVRCVGNTLLLNGRVFSPPFTIAAVGPAGVMRAGLDASPNVALYRRDANAYGLGYDVTDESTVALQAYQAPVALSYATAAG